MRKYILALFLMVGMISNALAENVITLAIPDAKIVGKGRLSVVFWDVYDATLYAPDGKWAEGKPSALSVHYFRQIEGPDIADRSAHEIRKQGFADEVKLAAWRTQMRSIFPDVHNGSVLTVIYTQGKPTRFYLDDKEIGSVVDPDFGEAFLNIWLSDKTSEPELRRKLLGKS